MTTSAQPTPLLRVRLLSAHGDLTHCADYCGVMEDLELYWPLVRPGGIIAGHDYEDAASVAAATQPYVQDWGLCHNGTRHQGAVRAAVDDFFGGMGLQVVATYKEEMWNTWMVRQPLGRARHCLNHHNAVAPAGSAQQGSGGSKGGAGR